MKSALLAALLNFAIPLSHLRSQATQPRARDAGSPQVGQQLFSSNCSGCHGLDGHGGEHGPNIATTAEVQRLSGRDILGIIRDGIPATGMPAFRSRFDATQLHDVASYVRVLQGKYAAAFVPGNSETGRALFFGKARCSECHMIAGEGGFIGSDLTAYGEQHSPDVVRSAILDPNNNLDPRHRAVTAVTRDGRKFTGRALNEDNFSLQLQTLNGTFHFFEKSSLARLEREPGSIMPSNYGSILSPRDLDDLVSYLMKSRAPQASRPGEDDEP
ncbi:MAG: c-type cytochrome [Bryobacteraceae bacterium]